MIKPSHKTLLAFSLHVFIPICNCIDISLGHQPTCNMEAEFAVGIKYSFMAVNLFYLIHKPALEW